MPDPEPLPGAPTPPIEIAGGAAGASARLTTPVVPLPDGFVAELRGVCAEVLDDPADRAEASRDWWPLAMVWATEGQVGRLAAVVARPADTAEVAAVVAACHDARCPGHPGRRTQQRGRRRRCRSTEASSLDLCRLTGIVSVDPTSMIVEVLAGTFGDAFEDELQGKHAVDRRATGRSRWRCPPSAAGSPAAAPASCRTATARSRTSSSASRSSWPTAR